MGRFRKELKEKEVTLGDEKFVIKALTGKHMSIFVKLGDNKEEALKQMILASLQEADKTITAEDVDELSLGEISSLMEAVMEVNNLG